jgi:hypothetical protein
MAQRRRSARFSGALRLAFEAFEAAPGRCSISSAKRSIPGSMRTASIEE